MERAGENKRFAFETLIAVLSTRFINCPISEIDQGIETALAELGRATHSDRTYLILLSADQATLHNTHEWCAPGVASQIEELQAIPRAEVPWVNDTILVDVPMHVPSVADLGEAHRAEKAIFESGGIRSLICVPVKLGTQILGLCGLDSVTTEQRWTPEEIEILRITGEMFANAIERKQMEEKRQLLESQLSQTRTMAAVERLAGGVAHDFNNLLTVILGNAHIAQLIASEDTELSSSLEGIIDSAERAAELAGRLLSIGRSRRLEPTSLSLNEEIRNLEKIIRRLVSEDVEIDIALDSSLSSIHADSSEISRLLLNLVANATDAMAASGGRLTIRTENVELGQEQAELLGGNSGPRVLLTVSDTGCGIPAEHLNHIFEPFYTTKKVGQGTGLGLSSVYGVVRQHGGFLQVESQKGQGTCFRVYLQPAGSSQSAERPRAELPYSRQPTNDLCILVVEDEEVVQKLVTQVLRRAGFQVLSARNGEEALHPRTAQEAGSAADQRRDYA